jgi:hypothetical protein
VWWPSESGDVGRRGDRENLENSTEGEHAKSDAD